MASKRSVLDRVEDRLPAPAQAVLTSFRDAELMMASAGLAFYALVSAAPLAILVLWVVSLAAGDARTKQMATDLERVMPKGLGAGGALQKVADAGTRLGVASIVAALWPATAYGAGLTRAFDRLSTKRGRDLKGLRGRGLAVLVLLPLFFAGGLVGTFVVTGLLHGIVGTALGWVLGATAGLVGAGASTALIYGVFPPRRLPWPDILRAAAAASSAIAVVSLLFVVYLRLGVSFEEHYASAGMAGLVLLGLWLLLANLAVLAAFRWVDSEHAS